MSRSLYMKYNVYISAYTFGTVSIGRERKEGVPSISSNGYVGYNRYHLSYPKVKIGLTTVSSQLCGERAGAGIFRSSVLNCCADLGVN